MAFTLNIETDNTAFEAYPTEEVARILRDAAEQIERGAYVGIIRDYNGNTVGKFELDLPDPEEDAS